MTVRRFSPPVLRALAVCALLSVGLTLAADTSLSHAHAREATAREFSAAETERLTNGKLVVRREQVTRRGAHLIGGFSWQRIDADVADVWKAMTDISAYPKFLPAVASVERLGMVGSSRRLGIVHRTMLVETSYFVLVRADPTLHAFAFRLDRSRPAAINDAWGEMRVTPYGNGASIVSLAIMADLGSGLIARLVRSQVHEWMLRIPEQLKRHVMREKRRRS